MTPVHDHTAALLAAGLARRRADEAEAEAAAALAVAARAVFEARQAGKRVNMSAAAGLAGVARPTLYAHVRRLEHR